MSTAIKKKFKKKKEISSTAECDLIRNLVYCRWIGKNMEKAQYDSSREIGGR